MAKYKILVNGQLDTGTDSLTIAAASFQIATEKAFTQDDAEKHVVELQFLEEKKFVRVTKELGELA